MWIIARRAVDDDVIGGHHIRRGTTVDHPDPPHSPRPALVARPGNLRSRPVLADRPKTRPRSAYLPFGGGRRICIGQSFALMEMVLMAAIISQRFTFDVRRPDHPVELEATLDAAAQARAAHHRKQAPHEHTPDYHVLIVGAGFSGIGAAIKLDRAGLSDYLRGRGRRRSRRHLALEHLSRYRRGYPVVLRSVLLSRARTGRAPTHPGAGKAYANTAATGTVSGRASGSAPR